MHAECVGVLGHGYYATGPQRDVRDVPPSRSRPMRPAVKADCRTRGCEHSVLERLEWVETVAGLYDSFEVGEHRAAGVPPGCLGGRATLRRTE
jgi:hypothetical protein